MGDWGWGKGRGRCGYGKSIGYNIQMKQERILLIQTSEIISFNHSSISSQILHQRRCRRDNYRAELQGDSSKGGFITGLAMPSASSSSQLEWPQYPPQFYSLNHNSYMHLQSKSQLDNSHHSPNLQNVEFDHFQSSMKQPHDTRSQHLPSLHSQNLNNSKRSLENTDYKRQLLKLMVVVKLQAYGYKEEEMRMMVEYEIAHLEEEVQDIAGKDLDLVATEISLNIVAGLFGEIKKQGAARSRSSHSERAENHFGPASLQRELEMEMAEVRQPQILCNICYNLSASYCEQLCGHTFCMDCMKGYIRENQRSGNYIVKCPEYDCPEFVTVDVIKKVLGREELQRFLHFREKNEKEMNPDNKFCSKPDCGELLERGKDRLKCPKCNSDYCQICLQGYHEDNPCDIILKNTLEHTYKSFRIKKCPSCKSPIEKSEGCNHMTCKKCKHQFCWLCLKKYSHHHYRYYNCFGCPGMQFQEEQELVMERVKQLVLFLLMPFILTLVFFCFFAAIPIYILGTFLDRPCQWVNSERDIFEAKLVHEYLCCCLGDFLKNLFMWILVQPRAALYAVFVSPVKLTLMFCGELCKVFE